jgi:hypothetical protein
MNSSAHASRSKEAEILSSTVPANEIELVYSGAIERAVLAKKLQADRIRGADSGRFSMNGYEKTIARAGNVFSGKSYEEKLKYEVALKANKDAMAILKDLEHFYILAGAAVSIGHEQLGLPQEIHDTLNEHFKSGLVGLSAARAAVESDLQHINSNGAGRYLADTRRTLGEEIKLAQTHMNRFASHADHHDSPKVLQNFCCTAQATLDKIARTEKEWDVVGFIR